MRRFFVFSFIATALLFLFGGFFLLNRLMQYRSEIALLKEDGFPVSIADLELDPAAGQVDATVQFSRLLGPLGSFETEMYKDEEIHDREVDETTIKLFNELNEAYPTVYPLVTEVANADFVGFEKKGLGAQETLDFELLRLQQIRSCARVLNFKARVLAAQGKPDEALECSIEILKVVDNFGRYPTLVAQLVRHACRGIAIASAYEILSKHKVKPETRAQLNTLLEASERSDEYRWTLISERAFGSSILSEMGTVPMAFSGSGYLGLIGDELAQCDKEAFAKDLSFENEISWFDGTHARMILPALQQTRLAGYRLRSQLRGLRIVNALTAKPESAEKEITKEYLVKLGVPESMTIDTMDGKPMRIKRIDDNWVVYSIGPDLVDDGGVKAGAKDFVVGPE